MTRIETLKSLNEAISVYLEKARPKSRILGDFRRMVRLNERKLLPKVKEWMKLMIEDIQRGLPKMRKARPKKMVEKLADWDRIRQEGEIILKPVLLDILVESGRRIVEGRVLKQERFDPIGTAAVAWATVHAAELVKQITAQTQDGIAAVIQEGINQGKSIQKIAMELRPLVGLNERQSLAASKLMTELMTRPKYAELTMERKEKMLARYVNKLHRQRTLLIAQTETATSLREGIIEGYEQMDIKKLEGVSDPECCDWCQENISGKIVTTEEARSLNAEAHPGCECGFVIA